jgi:hypothetical protein
MSEAAAGVVAFGAATGEDLSLASEAAEGFGVEDAAAIADEGRAVGMGGLGPGAADEGTVFGDGDAGRKPGRLLGGRRRDICFDLQMLPPRSVSG